MAAPIVVVGELALLYVRLGYYGNWGGAGWSGGEFLPSEINWDVPGKDPQGRPHRRAQGPDRHHAPARACLCAAGQCDSGDGEEDQGIGRKS